ncbi:MAG: ATP-binding protein [Chitinophagaceae bacterium]
MSLPDKVVYYLVGVFCVITLNVSAQDQKLADSLARIYHEDKLTDTAKLELLRQLSFNEVHDFKLSLRYAEELINMARQQANDKYLFQGYFQKGNKRRLLGDYQEALKAYFKSAEVAEKTKVIARIGSAYGAIADVYALSDNYSNAMLYYRKAITTLRQSLDSISLASAILNAGEAFRNSRNYDSALLFFRESEKIFEKKNYPIGKAYALGNIGMVYASTGKNTLAEKNMNEAIIALEASKDYYPICAYLISMCDIYLEEGDAQKALDYAQRSLNLAQQYGLKEQISAANLKLSELYEKAGILSAAFNHYKKYILFRDSFNNVESVRKMADLSKNFEVSHKQAEVNLLNQQKRNQKNLVITLGIILGLTIVILAILLKNNQNKQKAYKILNIQKLETDMQKSKAEDALNELQVTQKQLIQSAKMASLGELTAGIAHEIQNPLNFVNNFSEVSVELLSELIEGTVNKLAASDKAKADEIINDLADNLKKISHHGKRADSIVKGMLQHSRVSANKKEPTDINTLADEYLRLSYHGLRAKDNTFNVSIETSFDNNIEKLLIVPQDIGRVLLNICNNAFYSVHKKTKLNIESYEPKLWLTTKGIVKDGALEAAQISIRDNGMGIPDKILNKIYQPFFTTKPAGQGTGLGLSLSYDIITTEHNGQLNVETKEGEYAEFTIELPNKK